MNTVRLQKFLSQAGVSSRRKAEDLIVQGAVKINGKVVTELGTKIDPRKDKISVSGEVVKPQFYKIYAFSKPANVITTMSDPQKRPCVGDYVSKLAVKVFPIGRLDFDAGGLLLFTNNGDYANHLLHPRYEVPRSYWAVLNSFISDEQLEALTRGIKLSTFAKATADRSVRNTHIVKADSSAVALAKAEFAKRVQPSSVSKYFKKPISSECSVVNIIVREGRNHFVKRLFEHFGFKVEQLFRHAYGPYKIGTLKSGEIREIEFRNVRKL